LTLTLVAGLWKYFSFKEIDKEMIKKMIKYSLPIVPTAIMWLITGFSDRLFLKYMDYSYQFTGDTATGIYSAASKIPNLIAMVSTIFFQAWNMSAIMESKSEDLENFYTNVYKAYQSVLYIAAAWLIALSIPLSAILLDYETDPLYRYCYRYTPILVVAVLMMCFSQFLSSVYNVTKKTRNSFFTSVVSAVVNIILNIILIKRMGIQGAGIATLVSYLTCYIIRLIDCRKQIPFSTDMIKEALNFVVIILMCVVLIVLPVGWIDYLIAGTLYITVANFGAVIKTLKRFLERRNSA
ncbi:MAG: polysaccharide biosynthesis C-terminal domain-containing protein, partial [Oscillospiraceae bacterium]|nr:polysaccharide biosynthesis C-terminal domain-containing protein [Oscillospiraceae bacterium]